jgi:phage-related minor tail protein
MASLGSLIAKVSLDYAEAELGADRTSQAVLKMGDDITRAVTKAVSSYKKGVGDMSAANDGISESVARATAGVTALAETEEQAAARIREMVARSREAQDALNGTASAANQGAAGIAAVGASADQVRATITAQTAAMSATSREMAAMSGELETLRTVAAQGGASFETLGEQYSRLDRLMASGKLSMEEYDATLSALGKDEERRLQQLNTLTSRYDPLGAATRKLTSDQALLDDAYKSGQVTTEQYQKALAGIKTDQAAVQLRGLVEQEVQLERAFKSGQISASDYKKAMADIKVSKSGLTDLAAGASAGASAMDSLGLHTASARKEIVVLAHEAATGSWRNFGGSLMVLAERMDIVEKLTSPLALGIGAIAAASYVAYEAIHSLNEQQQAISNAMALTANYADLTQGKLLVLSDAISRNLGVSTGVASEAIMAMAKSGLVAGSDLEEVSESIVAYSKASGESVDKAAQMFEQAYGNAAGAAQKWAETHHDITQAQLENIKVMEQSGDKAGAWKAFVVAASAAAREQVIDDNDKMGASYETLGEKWDRFWRTVTGKGDQLTKLHDQLAALESQKYDPDFNLLGVHTDEINKQEAAIRAQIDAIRKASQAQEDQGKARRTFDSMNEQHIEDMKKTWTWQQKLNDANETARQKTEALTKAAKDAGKLTPAYQAQLQADLNATLAANGREYHAPSHRASGQSALNERISAELATWEGYAKQREAILAASQKNLESLHRQGLLSDTDYINRTHDEQIKALQDEQAIAQQQADIAGGKKALAERNKYLAKVEELSQKEQAVEQDRADKLAERDAKAASDYLASVQKQIDAAQQQDQGLQDQIATFGMSKAAIDDLKAARADDAVAALEQGRAIAIMNGNLADTSGYDAAIERAKSLSKALHQIANDQSILDQKEAEKKVADQAVQDWKSAANSIESGITNALMNGFDKGKSFGQQLADSLKAMFKTLVLQPIIAPVAGGMASLMYPGGAQAYAAQNPNSPLTSLLQNPYGTYNNLSNAYDTVTGWIQGYGGASTALGSAAIAGAGSGALSAGGVTLGGLGGAIGGDVAASAGTYGAALGANTYGFTAGSAGGSLGLGGTLGSSAGLMYGGAGLLGGLAGGALFGNQGYSSMGGSLGAMGGLALGASSAVAGTAIGAALGSWAGPIGAVAGMLLGSALGSLFGGGETRYGTVYTSDGTTASKLSAPSGGDPASDQVKQQVNSTYQTIQSLASQMGGSTDGLGTYTAGYEISPKKGNSFVVAGFQDNPSQNGAGRQDLKGVKDSQTVLDDLSLQLQRSVISSLQQAHLDKPYADYLAQFDASALTADQITSIEANLQTMASLFKAISGMGPDFDNLKQVSTAAQLAVVNLAGGIDSFNSSASYFYQHFTSAAQQADDAAKAMSDQLDALGYSGVHTRDQFKDLVESLDLSTDAGQKAYIALLNLAPAFDTVVSSYESAVKSAYDTQSQALTSFKSQVDQFRTSLASGQYSTASPEQQYADTQQRFEDLYSKAMSGDADAQSNLTSAAQDFLNASKTYNASSGQYQADLTEVMQAMDYASSSADEQLDQLKQMVQGIVDVNDSVQTVAEAIAALQGWTSVNGSHASGLYRVPFDGYIAELHQGERVLTADEAKAFDALPVSSPAANLTRYQSRGNDALIAEIKSLRSEVAQLRADRNQADVAHATQRAQIAKQQSDDLEAQTSIMRSRARPGK